MVYWVSFTAATRAALRVPRAVKPLPPQWVKGQPEPVVVLGLAEPVG